MKLNEAQSMIERMNFLNCVAELPIISPNGPVEAMPSYEGAFLKMILTLASLLVVVFGVIWVLKRFARGRWSQHGGRSIKTLETLALSPKTVLYLIHVNGRDLLISESQLDVELLVTLKELPKEKE